jgi:hypothetical protein
MVKWLVTIGLMVASQTPAVAQQSFVARQQNVTSHVIVFALQKEIQANQFKSRDDVCVGLWSGSKVDENAIRSGLRHAGLNVHANGWCNNGRRGAAITVLSLRHSGTGYYELEVETSEFEPVRREGAHAATVLRRGMYAIRCEEGWEPLLEAYQQDCCTGIIGREKVEEFCSSHTTASYHSPQCDLWVVHDRNRVADVRIQHKPEYHTYSRWRLGEQTYVLAYRDVDSQPSDMVADIYLVNEEGYRRVGKISVHDIVTDVSALALTEGEVPDLVFRAACGHLQCMFIVRFADGMAQQVFSYGASQIELSSEQKPKVLAKSTLANLVEEFSWDARAGGFRQVREYRWHNEE